MTAPRIDLLRLPNNRSAFALHPRDWQSNRYVYPVISRRSGGLSIGINLNPDKICNFDCIYCCVNRKTPGDPSPISLTTLTAELAAMLNAVVTGELFTHPPFSHVSPELRRFNDIAFSGDGEPTSSPEFPACLKLAKAALDDRQLKDVKIVLITNATLLHRPLVKAALNFLDACHGEIWAKLDAGTDAYYKLIDRTSIPLDRIVSNITTCAAQRPVVIQSLFMKIHGASPPPEEIDAYSRRLATILDKGGKLKRIQIYTVARKPAEPSVSPLGAGELEAVVEQVSRHLTSHSMVKIEAFP